MSANAPKNDTAVPPVSLEERVEAIYETIRGLYLADEIPWVVGYSGGKDSTATLQLVWYALADLPAEQRRKPVYVISTDTLVENPIVAMWVDNSLRVMEQAAGEQRMPVQPNRLTPDVTDSFWVNLIGRGYPAPRPRFRWCTSRLKINPSNRFITDVVRHNGEAILVLGTRKAESAVRASNMAHYEKGSTRDLLSEHGQLERSWVFTPIADWSNDDVWHYLATIDNPWGHSNIDLVHMYRGASEDNECPLVVDTSTPSCGDSRFGCYVCTLVGEDKSMAAMIQNDHEKEWLAPLLEFRNHYLNTQNDRQHRDFRRMNGTLLVHNGRLVHGPYKQSYRQDLLRGLLQAQERMRKAAREGSAPDVVRHFEAIRLEELQEIRRIWVVEKHEVEDALPGIYAEVVGKPYPGPPLNERSAFGAEDMALLQQVCASRGDQEGIQFELLRRMLRIEERYRTMARRSGLYKELDKALETGAFRSADEAEQYALRRQEALDEVREGMRSSYGDEVFALLEGDDTPEAMVSDGSLS